MPHSVSVIDNETDLADANREFQMEPVARRLYRLVEPIHLVAYLSEEPDEELMALGYRGTWDCYFAGRAAPLGQVPAAVVHAVFYNFADGEVARHIPRVWDTATPGARWPHAGAAVSQR